MKKALLVAKWEFLTTVTRPAFIFAVVGMPLFYVVMFGIAGLAGRSAASSTSRAPVAIVDQARLLDLAFATEQAANRELFRKSVEDTSSADALRDLQQLAATRSPMAAAQISQLAPAAAALTPYGDVDAALADLKQRRISTVFVIDRDYVSNGLITVYSRDGGLFGIQADRQRQTQVADAIRASLLKPAMSGNVLDRAFAPVVRVNRMQLTSQGTFERSTDDTGLGPLAGSAGIMLLLTMSIFFSAGFLQQATIADRQNKVIEILLSSLDSDELVLGKLMGLGGAGLVQVGIYVALIVVPGIALLSIFQVPLIKLALTIVFFVIGYLTFACLMTASGMVGRTAQESAQISVLWIMTAAAPWFFIANIGAAPNGPLARTLSFFPLTSPITMMMRLSSTDVAALEVAGVLLVDAVGIYLIFRAATKIFRAQALMYGKRATLPEIVRWLRAA